MPMRSASLLLLIAVLQAADSTTPQPTIPKPTGETKEAERHKTKTIGKGHHGTATFAGSIEIARTAEPSAIILAVDGEYFRAYVYPPATGNRVTVSVTQYIGKDHANTPIAVDGYLADIGDKMPGIVAEVNDNAGTLKLMKGTQGSLVFLREFTLPETTDQGDEVISPDVIEDAIRRRKKSVDMRADARVKVSGTLDDPAYSIDLFADLADTIPVTLERPAIWTLRSEEVYLATPDGQFTKVEPGQYNAYTPPVKPENPMVPASNTGFGPIKTGDVKDTLQLKISTIQGVIPGSLIKVERKYDVGHQTPRVESTFVRVDHYRSYFAPTVIPFLATSDKNVSDDESPWSLGMASGVEYRRKFYGSGDWYDFWNFVEPAVGVHGALLNEREGNVVDIGLGGHISLFQGWVAGGAGHNFSDNSPYFFVGVNLIPATRRAVK